MKQLFSRKHLICVTKEFLATCGHSNKVMRGLFYFLMNCDIASETNFGKTKEAECTSFV